MNFFCFEGFLIHDFGVHHCIWLSSALVPLLGKSPRVHPFWATKLNNSKSRADMYLAGNITLIIKTFTHTCTNNKITDALSSLCSPSLCWEPQEPYAFLDPVTKGLTLAPAQASIHSEPIDMDDHMVGRS
jgi:hypothetical protein